MDCLRITGGTPLVGTVTASGAKNAALPMMAAAILSSGTVELARVPLVADVDTLSLLLGYLGVEVKRGADDILRIATVDPRPTMADFELVRRMRASFCVLGPLLARRGRAVVPLPGGCKIGSRPVDLHLAGLAALGAELRIERGHVVATARRLRGARIHLAGRFGPTVTGTANVMSAAVLAEGRTTITGAALEPEIEDLGRLLTTLGARISGIGTSTLEIDGVGELSGGRHEVIADRIEVGTLLLAAAVTRGCVTIERADGAHLAAVLDALRAAGCRVTLQGSDITLETNGLLRAFDLSARPYPGIPTDLQSQFVALAALAEGSSTIRDQVFPERFSQLPQLVRLGARIERSSGLAKVCGVKRLTATTVTASDLRASAALVLAGLAANGTTVVRRVEHLDRGYERLDCKLRSLGARIMRTTDNPARADRLCEQPRPWALPRVASQSLRPGP